MLETRADPRRLSGLLHFPQLQWFYASICISLLFSGAWLFWNLFIVVRQFCWDLRVSMQTNIHKHRALSFSNCPDNSLWGVVHHLRQIVHEFSRWLELERALAKLCIYKWNIGLEGAFEAQKNCIGTTWETVILKMLAAWMLVFSCFYHVVYYRSLYYMQ